MEKLDSDIDKKRSNKFIDEYLKQDGVFVMRLVGHNTNAITVTEFVCSLWDHYIAKPVVECDSNDFWWVAWMLGLWYLQKNCSNRMRYNCSKTMRSCVWWLGHINTLAMWLQLFTEALLTSHAENKPLSPDNYNAWPDRVHSSLLIIEWRSSIHMTGPPGDGSNRMLLLIYLYTNWESLNPHLLLRFRPFQVNVMNLWDHCVIYAKHCPEKVDTDRTYW